MTREGTTHRAGRHFTVISSDTAPDARRTGIYLRGGCDLPAVFAMAPLMNGTLTGTCAILRDLKAISGSRSDVVLQSLTDFDADARKAMDEVVRRLSLKRDYFSPDLFAPAFRIRELPSAGEFPKSVIVLSLGPDFARTVYRHRRHGFLVDPGAFWLNSDMSRVLSDPDTVKWFGENFKRAGRMSVDTFRESFGRLLTEIEQRVGAHVLVFNVLTVDPSDTTHNYAPVIQSDTARRRAFIIALAEMSGRYGFDIVDVDRILKLGGVRGMVDFGHPSQGQFGLIGADVLRILRTRQLV